jgi:hypothetical protein
MAPIEALTRPAPTVEIFAHCSIARQGRSTRFDHQWVCHPGNECVQVVIFNAGPDIDTRLNRLP